MYSVIEEYTLYKMPGGRAMMFNVHSIKLENRDQSRLDWLAQQHRRLDIPDPTLLDEIWERLPRQTCLGGLNTTRSVAAITKIGYEQVDHAPSVTSGAARYSYLTATSPTESNPIPPSTTICNCTKCRPNIILAQFNSQTTPTKLPSRSLEEESQV